MTQAYKKISDNEAELYFIKAISLSGMRHINDIFPEYHHIIKKLVDENVFNIENGWISLNIYKS